MEVTTTAESLRSGKRFRVLLVAVGAAVVIGAISGGLLASRRAEPPQGRSFALDLLNQAPLPPGAVIARSAIRGLEQPPSIVGCSPLWDLHKVVLVGSSTDVRRFVQAHLPKDDAITGSGFSGGPGVRTVTSFTVTIGSSLGSRAPLVLYSFESAGRRTALRVDTQVMLPTSRCGTHGIRVTVPDVVTARIRAALRIVARAGFVARRVSTELCIGAVMPVYPHIGSVAEQHPAAFTYAKRGSTITLFEPTRSNPACA